MERNLYNRTSEAAAEQTGAVTVNGFINRVYSWMSAGLALTGVIAWFVAANFSQQIAEHPGVFIVMLIAEVALVIGLSSAINKISSSAAIGGFLLYAALNGVTLSTIFLAYTASSISLTFFTCCATFAGMSLYGYTTKKDLTSVGSFCGMAIWGLIIGGLLNMFFGGNAFSMLLSVIGVAVFIGLTAYDTWKLKEMALAVDAGELESETGKKVAVIGALQLYLDFINLFLYLLRLFGNRRN